MFSSTTNSADRSPSEHADAGGLVINYVVRMDDVVDCCLDAAAAVHAVQLEII